MMTPMVRTLDVVALATLALALGACGNDIPSNDPDAPTTPPLVDAAPFEPPAGYTKLISRTWSLPAGATDTYRCARVTVPVDTYLTSIIAQAPGGTHHTVLSISDSSTAGPDGDYNCNVAELGMQMLYASGVGTSPLDFPTDVGVKIAAGTQIHLNLHLFNATEATLAGDSGIWVKASSTPPPTLAEMTFAGTFDIEIPSTNQPVTIQGGCTASQSYTLFALWPHMHQTAIHSKFELVHDGTTTTLLDEPYAFGEQTYWPQTPEVQVTAGDQIRVTCTYRNNTGDTIRFGDSSNAEMCFTGIYRYPAVGTNLFGCASGGNPL